MSPVESVWAQLRRPAVQRGVRAAVAAALAWQVAVLLPPLLRGTPATPRSAR